MRKIFLLLFISVFLIILVSAESCSVAGEYNETHYCDINGTLQGVKADDSSCLNNFECANNVCTDGFCETKLEGISEQEDTIEEIRVWFTGMQCGPGETKCEGTVYYMCGAEGAWEGKGAVAGKCGVSSGRSGGGCTPNWVCGNWTTYNAESNSYCGTRVCTDKKNCRKEYGKPLTYIQCATPLSATLSCGDGICSKDENSYTCEEDCEVVTLNSRCGNHVCEKDESSFTCSEDCVAKSVKKTSYIFWSIIGGVIIVVAGGIFFIRRKMKAKLHHPQQSSSVHHTTH